MKKAKSLLTAIAVLAVVGGALAFKSTKIYGSIMYTDDPHGRQCTVPMIDCSVNTASDNPNTFASSAPTFTTCPAGECYFLP